MKIIKPRVKIITEKNLIRKIRMAYAICYKNEDNIDWKNCIEWIERKVAMGHSSPCEHVRVKIPYATYDKLYSKFYVKNNNKLPYGFQSRVNVVSLKGKNFVYMNVRDWLNIGGKIRDIERFEEAPDYMTVKIICNRGISHELVRHRQMAFTQESTRYCNYKSTMKFIEQGYEDKVFDDKSRFKIWMRNLIFKWNCKLCEIGYKWMLRFGATPQEARNVLPNSLKTEIWVTGTETAWNDFYKLRLAKGAHPQMREIAAMIMDEEHNALYTDNGCYHESEKAGNS